jgi:hypothetical protein
MKKYSYFLGFILLTILLVLQANNALAYSFANTNEFLTNTATHVGYDQSQKDYTTIIANIIKTVLTLVGIIFIVLIIYGGFLYMTSASESEKVKKAKNTIIYSAIGLIIILAAYSITYFVSTMLEAGGTTSPGSNPTTCAGSGGVCNPDCTFYGTHSVGVLDCAAGKQCCITGTQ